MEPEENTLSLVYRDKESLKFVMYVHDIENFLDVAFTYYDYSRHMCLHKQTESFPKPWLDLAES